MSDVCKYAENPNFNTFVLLMDSLSKIVAEEDSILRTKFKSIEDGKFASILSNKDNLRCILDQLKRISSQLRTQKTR